MQIVISQFAIIERCADALSASLGDELVFLSMARSDYFGTGRVGQRIWDLLADPSSVAGIAAVLGREYAVDPITCEREVAAFVVQLIEAGLVREKG